MKKAVMLVVLVLLVSSLSVVADDCSYCIYRAGDLEYDLSGSSLFAGADVTCTSPPVSCPSTITSEIKNEAVGKIRENYLGYILPSKLRYNQEQINWDSSSITSLNFIDSIGGAITITPNHLNGITTFNVIHNTQGQNVFETVNDDYFAVGNKLLYSQTIAQAAGKV